MFSFLFKRKPSLSFQVLRNLIVFIQGKMWEIFTDKHNRSCKTKSFLIHDIGIQVVANGENKQNDKISRLSTQLNIFTTY